MLEAERGQYSEPRHTRELTVRRQSTVSASIYRYRPEDGCARLRRTSPSEILELIYTLPGHFFSQASEGSDYRTGGVDPAQTGSLEAWS